MDYCDNLVSKAEQKFVSFTGYTPKQMETPVGHVFKNSVFFTENEEMWNVLRRQLEIKENLKYLTSGAILFSSALLTCIIIAMLFFSLKECLIIGGMFFVGHMLFVWLTIAAKKKELKKLQAMSLNRFFEVPL